ncbi:unnamed protein product [Lactuca saligna]|uniref:Uncharacterized protein n=1 Tax=Lactuca saligna TaxID=75948 RepID=A0AA35Y7G5_LACSI|nr:unnamed protein product [Lactuca saligna]
MPFTTCSSSGYCNSTLVTASGSFPTIGSAASDHSIRNRWSKNRSERKTKKSPRPFSPFSETVYHQLLMIPKKTHGLNWCLMKKVLKNSAYLLISFIDGLDQVDDEIVNEVKEKFGGILESVIITDKIIYISFYFIPGLQQTQKRFVLRSYRKWEYIEAIREIENQLQRRTIKIAFDHIVVACGSGGIIVGLSIVSCVSEPKTKVCGPKEQ